MAGRNDRTRGYNPAVAMRLLATPLWISSLLAIATLLLLPSQWKLDGRSHADWIQFVGRFHPLAVHLPIGMILLVPLLEAGGFFRPALREAAAFVLGLSVLACMGAVTLGYLLAYGSGIIGARATHHMWGGISLTIGVLVCFLIRPTWASGKLCFGYPALLTGVLVLLSWTCHQGGSLTHGENYLTEYLPAPLRRWMGPGTKPESEQVVANSFYAMRIRPIFDANCFACHSKAKVEGGLQLDSYSLLMKGGRDGVVIVPGLPDKSPLYYRITLPPDHKQFMPAEGKPPLKPEQVALIKAWIFEGASATATTITGVTLPEEHKILPPPQVGDYSQLMNQISQIEQAQGISLAPVSRNPGDGLILRTINATPKLDDAQLAQLERFAPYIVEADLGHTNVTDACFDTLAKFTNLRALHLEDTAITGKDLAKLNQLPQLTYLNLTGTKVTASTITPLSSMKNLQHLYLYNTPGQPKP